MKRYVFLDRLSSDMAQYKDARTLQNIHTVLPCHNLTILASLKVDGLIRDTSNPSSDDEYFPRFRRHQGKRLLFT